MSLWGGGVNAQVTLPLGTVQDVEREVARTIPVLARQGQNLLDTHFGGQRIRLQPKGIKNQFNTL